MTTGGVPVPRRQFLVGLGAVASVLRVPHAALADEHRHALKIRPRDTWGSDLPAVGPLRVEKPEDVRFVLVHHTASSNDYSPDGVVNQLRTFYRYHTESKGWPDVAYNFFVDRFGRIWEGRTGSLQRPVRGSATGGSQGHALLCCFVGDLSTAPPTWAAQSAMVDLVVHLSEQYRIDVTKGAHTTFASRGSNRWPEGTKVTTPTIAAHRDMSLTACPGKFGYEFVTGALRHRVASRAPESVAVAPGLAETRTRPEARFPQDQRLRDHSVRTSNLVPADSSRTERPAASAAGAELPIGPAAGGGAAMAVAVAALVAGRRRGTNKTVTAVTNGGGSNGSV